LKEHYAGNELTKSIEEKENFAKKNLKWRKLYMTQMPAISIITTNRNKTTMTAPMIIPALIIFFMLYLPRNSV
jgi:hypothetical protein